LLPLLFIQNLKERFILTELGIAVEEFSNKRKAVHDLFLNEHTKFVNNLYLLYKDEIWKHITCWVGPYELHSNMIFLGVEEIDFRCETNGFIIRCFFTAKFLGGEGTRDTNFNFWFCSLDNKGLVMINDVCLAGELSETAAALYRAQRVLFDKNRATITVTTHPELKSRIREK
jgi:hypothetical protein